MPRSASLALTTLIGLSAPASADPLVPDGYAATPSAFGVAETLDRLEAILAEREIPVHARYDVAAMAASVGTRVAPAETIVFGHPMAGTPFVAARPEAALELPFRATAVRTGDGVVLLHIDPDALAARYGLTGMDDHLDHLRGGMTGIIGAATAP